LGEKRDVPKMGRGGTERESEKCNPPIKEGKEPLEKGERKNKNSGGVNWGSRGESRKKGQPVELGDDARLNHKVKKKRKKTQEKKLPSVRKNATRPPRKGKKKALSTQGRKRANAPIRTLTGTCEGGRRRWGGREKNIAQGDDEARTGKIQRKKGQRIGKKNGGAREDF